jgi:hypothetical protein
LKVCLDTPIILTWRRENWMAPFGEDKPKKKRDASEIQWILMGINGI